MSVCGKETGGGIFLRLGEDGGKLQSANNCRLIRDVHESVMVMMMRGAGGRREVQKVAKECDHQTHTSTFLTHTAVSHHCVHNVMMIVNSLFFLLFFRSFLIQTTSLHTLLQAKCTNVLLS